MEEPRAGAGTEVAVEHAVLDVMFDRAPVGLAFWDQHLRCARVNRALAEMLGLAPGDLLGRRPGELAPGIGGRLEEALRTTLRTGRPREEIELTGRLPSDPGTTHTWVTSTFPIPGDGSARAR